MESVETSLFSGSFHSGRPGFVTEQPRKTFDTCCPIDLLNQKTFSYDLSHDARRLLEQRSSPSRVGANRVVSVVRRSVAGDRQSSLSSEKTNSFRLHTVCVIKCNHSHL